MPSDGQRRRLSPRERAILNELGHHAVVIVGECERAPISFGDNLGFLGVRVVVTKNPRAASQHYDQSAPRQAIETHCWVWTNSKSRGDFLGAGVTQALRDHSAAARGARRNVDAGFDLALLPLVLSGAADAAGVSIFDDAERLRLLDMEIRRRANVLWSR